MGLFHAVPAGAHHRQFLCRGAHSSIQMARGPSLGAPGLSVAQIGKSGVASLCVRLGQAGALDSVFSTHVASLSLAPVATHPSVVFFPCRHVTCMTSSLTVVRLDPFNSHCLDIVNVESRLLLCYIPKICTVFQKEEETAL